MNLSGNPRRLRAFSLPEIMVVMAIFLMVVLALVSCQLFGLKFYRIAETKLSATAEGRKALNQVREKVRQAKIVSVGNGNDVDFDDLPNKTPQIGNALQIHFTTNTAVFARYYMDTNDQTLKYITSLGGRPEIVSRFVTNQKVFRALDFNGVTLTNPQNNRVIHMNLDFYQRQFSAGTNKALYDHYRLQTRVTRRFTE